MSSPRAYAHPTPGHPRRAAEVVPRRSHAAIPVAIVLVALAAYFGQYTILIPGLIGLLLFVVGLSFLSTRINPLSPHFYLDRKPSWAAVGVVFLGALVLLWAAYAMWLHGVAPVFPRSWPS